MARNNNKMTKRHKMPKIEPSVQTMLFQTPGTSPSTGETFFIDLSQCASLANRRFYRQGLNWAVSRIRILSGTPGSMVISKLPSTWVMSNSWEKGFRSWEKMNDAALEETPSIKPRFLDFKIFADEAHHKSGYGANLLPMTYAVAIPPVGAVLVPPVPGEWESSKVVIPRTDSTTGVPAPRELIAVGANYPGAGASGLNAVSLIEGYAASRGLPNVLDPNAPDDAADTSGVAPQNWMSALFNEGIEQTSEVIEDLISENNIAPYPFENDGVNADTMYPGGANQMTGMQLHTFETITGTTVGGISTIKGGLFPCGLVRLDWFPTGTSANVIVEIDLVPGTHRGYLAESMQDL